MVMIGIAGRAGAGKDTLADHIIAGNPSYMKASLATPIKHALNTMFGWKPFQWEDRAWKETVIPEFGFSPRTAAQTLGTEWRDVVDPTKMLWCKALDIRLAFWRVENIVIPDVRFKHEVDWIHSHKGIVVYIHSTKFAGISSTHASENELSALQCDYVLLNNGTIQEMKSDFNNTMEGLL